jgi:hypothetical protein
MIPALSTDEEGEMSTDFSSTRLLVILGGALAFFALGFAALMLTHARSSSSDAAPLPVHHVVHHASGTRHRAAKHTVRLLPGLPAPVHYALLRQPTIVVSLYGKGSVDAAAAAEARAGASLGHAGFVGLDIRRDRWAGPIADFDASAADPAVLVVRRPGVIVRRLDGYQDRQIVAQAAHDAR